MTSAEHAGLLEGKVAVITGAGGILGNAIARNFLDQGARVALTDISATALAETTARLDAGIRAFVITAGVSDPSDVDRVVAETVTNFGRLDIWVNNAGVARDATMKKMTVDDFDFVIDVHLKGSWLGTRAAAGWMREHGGGSVINLSSISGKVGNAGQTNYSAAKAGIVGLTKAAAREVGFAGVRVNAIQPGLIESTMLHDMPADVQEARKKEIPLGRFGTPEEVANVALFLASDLSSYMTGTVVEIAGGRYI
jgi:3-oxoacyl-[acyl-carrier protein] reductase